MVWPQGLALLKARELSFIRTKLFIQHELVGQRAGHGMVNLEVRGRNGGRITVILQAFSRGVDIRVLSGQLGLAQQQPFHLQLTMDRK